MPSRAFIAALCLWFVLPGSAWAVDAPDLVPELRETPYAGQVAPVYIDAFEQPGRVLYRFDAILRNQGGALDLFRDAATGRAVQAVWAGGQPTQPPDPNQPPSSPDATLTDLSARGAYFAYVVEPSHEHWHFFSAARYELELPGGSRRLSDKVGFCLFDGFGDAGGATLYFPPSYTGSGSQTWCGFDHSGGSFVRMGLSPGAADRYASQREFQWVDIAGLAPGAYTLRAVANPDGSMLESDAANNVLRVPREIPGVVAEGADVERSSDGVIGIGLAGRIVAPEIPARRSAACVPEAESQACYTRALAGGPLSFRIVRPPRHGSVSISDAGGLAARALYRPQGRYRGVDSFEYTATDARGLESLPATVRVRASAPGRLLRGLAIRSRRGRWHALLRLSANARVQGRLDRRGSSYRLQRRLAARRLRAGRRRVALGRLRPGRYRLRLRLTPAGARPLRIVRRFRVRG